MATATFDFQGSQEHPPKNEEAFIKKTDSVLSEIQI